MALRKNILANYLGAGVITLAPILALPWYLTFLGSKQYGLLGFIATLQALLALLDAGLSQGLVREFTLRLDFDNGIHKTTSILLYCFERIYWLFSFLSGLLVIIFADFITEHWLNLGDLPKSLGIQAIYGAAVLFAVQFPGSIYRSLLIGAQDQVKLNGVMLVGTFLRHFGAVMILLISPTLIAYLLWNITVALLETLVRAWLAWSKLGVNRHLVGWNTDILQSTWVKLAGMSAATLLGALTVQIDKIVLSKMVAIDLFGYYIIASTIASGFLQLFYPILQGVLPRAIELRDRPNELRRLYLKLLIFISIFICILIAGHLFFGKQILIYWLSSTKAVEFVYEILSILLIGTVLNSFYNIGYINWLVIGNTKKILKVNLFSLILSSIFVPTLVVNYGVVGAAFGWVIINLTGLIVSLDWVRRN